LLFNVAVVGWLLRHIAAACTLNVNSSHGDNEQDRQTDGQ